MARDSRYDILFEPLQIGPVRTKNRFYQVPHCNGMGMLRPRMLAAMRGVKAEGGWGVVCTEYCSIHPTSDDLPHPYAALWGQADIKANALMTEQVHAHGALAGVELWAGGAGAANLLTREVPLGVSSMPHLGVGEHPVQTRAMDKGDIKDLRRWHRDAALRARMAGFDIVYVYATHDYLLSQFLSPVHNQRSDEYGGSLENRVRLIRELIEETKDAVGDTCAVAVRMAADEEGTPDSQMETNERRDMFELLAELPDLWDINIQDYSHEMGVSRFTPEASLEEAVGFVKTITSKPVVSVGRFTSPDTMAAQLRRGVLDLIGAARPSIADPYLPHKIETGRMDDIRECIGCNICYTGDSLGVPIRCTQNPTMGEEWRRGWHPERVPAKREDKTVLVIGAGPSGLESARVLGQRGYQVLLAEASQQLGGRVVDEAQLPGLRQWGRVRDYRVQQIQTLPNVQIYLDSAMNADEALSTEADYIAIATGAHWRNDGFGRYHATPCTDLGPESQRFTPNDMFRGRMPSGHVLLFDDDHYYMGSVIAEALVQKGCKVTYVTTSNLVCAWGQHTEEQFQVQQNLLNLGVEIVTAHGLEAYDGSTAHLSCTYTERSKAVSADALMLVTARTPNDTLYVELEARLEQSNQTTVINKIGDCNSPSIIAAAVYAGHRYGRELEEQPSAIIGHDRLYD